MLLKRAFLLVAIVGLGCATRPAPRAPAAAHADHTALDEQKIDAACDTVGWVDRVTPDQQQVINEVFAVRAHRLQHALWHAVRSGLPADEEQQVLTAFGSSWKQNHPLCPPPQNNPDSPAYNPAGEDFLYMHHQMVLLLRSALLAQGLKCITPWTEIPDPTQWPLRGNLHGPKSADAYARLQTWDAYIQDPANLRQISLSQLGWALEFTIHNNLHMRYADDRPAKPFRAAKAADDGAQIPMNGAYPANWKFDDPAYNWLADPYGAAVNPVFWKIHGYVEHVLSAWLTAHGKTHLALHCESTDATCYPWRGQWVGQLPILSQQTRAKGTRATASAAEDAAFNRQRLAHQRLGVLQDGDFLPGTSKGFAPVNLLDVAKASVCP